MADKNLATVEPGVWQEMLGYLNFSSGSSDSRFLRNLNELMGRIEAAGAPPGDSAAVFHRQLEERLAELSARSPAFADAEQARAVLRLVFQAALPAYRGHHRDLLFHLSDGELLRPLFIGRVFEAVLSEGPPWEETPRIVAGALVRLNDFIGHRPLAVLNTAQKIEPYSHERVRPIPWFIASAGAGVGVYHDLIAPALDLLRATDAALLDAAGFDPELLDELAVDPRAYDFNHPVNKRPNYHFGQWDPHLLDDRGRYRRFVVQQVTLDALLERIRSVHDIPRDELLFEAAAVLAGTILMASGTSGGSPAAHDSTTTLATLLPQIASYRDAFYHELFNRLSGAHLERLQAETAALHQPFAAARQHLNAQLARRRALQMQHVHLALVFARLGFPEAARRQSEIIPAVSARMICQIHCLMTSAHRAADRGRPTDGVTFLAQIEDLLHRGIECGAIVDPWNILGFGGQFSLFPAVENSIPDSRVDELLELMDRLFQTHARLWHQAAAVNDAEVLSRLPRDFQRLAEWWDQFATGAVSGVQWISGRESLAAARRVADALSAWHRAGAAGGDINFWRPYVADFDSPQAYKWVIQALLDHGDLAASMALLMHWLSRADELRLDDGPRSFQSLAERWLRMALEKCRPAAANEPPPTGPLPSGPLPSGPLPSGPLPSAAPVCPGPRRLLRKFFDFLEANADRYWDVPELEPAGSPRGPSKAESPSESPEESADDDDPRSLYSAAYDEVVYRDSTADDVEGSMLESFNPRTESEAESDSSSLAGRLGFLTTLSRLWKQVALAQAGLPAESVDPLVDCFTAWRERAAHNGRRLRALADAVARQAIPKPTANPESLVDYDRRWFAKESLVERVVAAIVAVDEAARFLDAAVGEAEQVGERDEETEEGSGDSGQGTGEADASPVEMQTASEQTASEKTASEKAAADDSSSEAIRGESVESKTGEGETAEGGSPEGVAAGTADRSGRAVQRLWRAVLTANVEAARTNFAPFLAAVGQDPLLYLRLARGGEPDKIAAVRSLQQTFRQLLRRLPRLGLIRETCQLIHAARAMERNNSLGPGAVTEFDRLFEVGFKALVESVVESSLAWSDSESRDEPVEDEDPRDGDLTDALQHLTESLLGQWSSHSHTLRLSVLEKVAGEKDWQELVRFVERYGHDLFTQAFFNYANLRAILHQGVDAWLDQLQSEPGDYAEMRLVAELGGRLTRSQAKKHLSLVIEAIVENYAEYRDYNATTTQSDRGELLYTLLDFLRLKSIYERIHWNLRPVMMVHEVLVRRGRSGAARLWARAMAKETQTTADQQLHRLAELQKKYGMRLSTIADRLAEQFLQPLAIDRLRALIRPAIEESRCQSAPLAFAALESEASRLAEEPSGAGLDLPDWLVILEEEVDVAAAPGNSFDDLRDYPRVALSWEEIQSQLAKWEVRLLEGRSE